MQATAARSADNAVGLASIQDWFRNPHRMEALADKAPPIVGAVQSATVGGRRVLTLSPMAAVGAETAASDSIWDMPRGVLGKLGRLASAGMSMGGAAAGEAAAAAAAAADVVIGGVVMGLLFIALSPQSTGQVVEGDLPDGGRYRWDSDTGILTLTTRDGSQLSARLEHGVFVADQDLAIGRMVNESIVIDQKLLKDAIAANILYNKRGTKGRRAKDDEDEDDEEGRGDKRRGRKLPMPWGFRPADNGAKEWGRRHDVDPKEAKNRFHEMKGDDNASEAPDIFGVNPDTGEVIDKNNQPIGNLNKIRTKGWIKRGDSGKGGGR